jgi:DNA modification methylase
MKETAAAAGNSAGIRLADCMNIIEDVPPIDLLIADPPYFTDGDFTAHVSAYLAKVKPTGQAYIFLSADPAEIAAYLQCNHHQMRLEQLLVWNYNNTGQRQPEARYNSNFQLCLYYRGHEAPPINKPADGKEQYACQTVNAPDGRQGDRFHQWQKPGQLIERLIRNSSAPGDFVFDPFAGTGTTMLAAARLGRVTSGCDISPEAVDIAVERGCRREV